MTPRRITVHCSDTPNGQPVSVDTIRKWHTDPPPRGRGWADIGYHEVIQPDGTTQPGRPITEQGAGVSGDNEDNVHVCLIGANAFTADQWNALRLRIDFYMGVYGVPAWEIHTHAQFPTAICQGKTCPGFPINRLLAWYFTRDAAPIAAYLFTR